MKNTIIYIILSLALISCEPNKLIELEGIQHVFIKNCVEFEESSYIIDDEESYLALFIKPFPTENCQDFQIPEIDFSTRTLLGYYTMVPGCEVKYRRTLFADPDEKEYLFQIYYQANECSDSHETMHWVSIPQLPGDYSVRFETEKE